jgi:UDP-N-acetylglucosamine 1-carboxyvinyltransferase
VAVESNSRLRFRFGKALRKARESSGISQAQLARTLGVSRGYIWQLEDGIKNLTLDRIETIAAAIGCEALISFRPNRR